MNALPAIALLASARAALGAAIQIGDRRAGRDASAQEPEDAARADLGALADGLAEQTVRLRLRAAVGAPSGPAAIAQAFEDRILLDDVGRTLAVAHQKLLSLYPAVDAALVEAVRQQARAARDRALADDPARGLGAFAAAVARLTDRLAGLA
ncbi:hypothetical protein [Rubrivirga sp. IMCC45206]|uniref:hypothetical protein n=1 Tax=Rubrivirga sp. IMCC45206 TaxID=3391614 RepID=UPI00398FF8D5